MSAAAALPPDDESVIECPNPECGVPLNASDIDPDGSCRYCCAEGNEVLRGFLARARAGVAAVAEAVQDALDDDKPEFPCEVCQVKPRMRTLPYCEDCAYSQGAL